ncbi:MAG: alkaline phosphatase family protein [Bacteroidetes bacterium]|nr:alkaline phosphatase family protein [Bacteroidota bacterium]
MNLTYSSKMRRFLFLVPLLFFAAACAQTDEGVDVREPAVLATEASLPVENVVLITLDGLRWEEVFTGADAWLLENPKYTSDMDAVRDRFWRESPEERREALMPFFWSTIASQGRIHGNRALGSNVNVTNTRVFSYPGYNEILTGFVDEAIDSNDKVPNANETLLEWVNKQPGFEGKVTAFGSWDVFPYIINEERSGVPVNAGFEAASGELTEKEAWLNQLQAQTPSPWTSVRLDVFTHNYALESLKQDRPRLLYISYGETDDFAHDAEYRHYLDAAQRTDEMIRELWDWVQSDPEYANRTAFVITTDHGRGDKERWIGHGGDWVGSENIWLAMLGPGITPMEETVQGQWYQNQVAATVADLLGLDYQNRVPVGASVIQP